LLKRASRRRARREGVLEKGYPNEFLREIAIVDTPGTNAIMRHHEELSRGFVPRSDLVLFVTSAERPLTESERGYLEHIRDWGKKILLVFNKADLLADESKVEEVPNRRRKAREQFREKTDSLRMRLGEVVRRQFEVESNRSVEVMREAIAPTPVSSDPSTPA
jgi:GTPase Era involved in 16S rRNA processing